MPVFEFSCRACGARFEELVGSHVGKGVEDVACPECGGPEVERAEVSEFAPISRQMTPAQKRRLEDKRGVDRGGARERFGKRRDAERARAKGRRDG